MGHACALRSSFHPPNDGDCRYQSHDVGVDMITLHRTLYSEAHADEILRVPPSTLHWWLEDCTVSPITER